MKLGFIMDPPDGIDTYRDTTFAIMLAAQKMGHRISYIAPEDVSLKNDTCWIRHSPCSVSRSKASTFEFEPEKQEPAGAFDALFVRKNPPFNVSYLHLTHLLTFAEKNCFVINKPAGLRAANEKLFAHKFSQYLPETLVTRSREQIDEFTREHGDRCIIKPIDGYGGRQIFILERDDKNYGPILDSMTDEGANRIVCQEYLDEAKKGDKRILLLDGNPLGAVLRVPGGTDHRGNLHVGGSAEKTNLTARDQEICNSIAKTLQEFGLWFVGIDIIGGKLTEINVTSPTGIQEIGRLDESNPSKKVIEWLKIRAA